MKFVVGFEYYHPEVSVNLFEIMNRKESNTIMWKSCNLLLEADIPAVEWRQKYLNNLFAPFFLANGLPF